MLFKALMAILHAILTHFLGTQHQMNPSNASVQLLNLFQFREQEFALKRGNPVLVKDVYFLPLLTLYSTKTHFKVTLQKMLGVVLFCAM